MKRKKSAGHTPAQVIAPRETVIVAACLFKLRCVPASEFWRVNTVARLRADGHGVIRAGPIGQADISGVIGPEGWRAEIEVKRPGGKLSDWQKAWRDTMLAHGAIWFLADDPDVLYTEILREIAKRRREQRS